MYKYLPIEQEKVGDIVQATAKHSCRWRYINRQSESNLSFPTKRIINVHRYLQGIGVLQVSTD